MEREEVAHGEPGDDGDGGDSGYDSEIAKTNSENGDDHHESTCDEVKQNTTGGEECEQSGVTDVAPAATDSEPPAVTQGDEPKSTVEVPAATSPLEDGVQTPAEPLVDVEVSFTTTESGAPDTNPTATGESPEENQEHGAELTIEVHAAVATTPSLGDGPTEPLFDVDASTETGVPETKPAATDESPAVNQGHEPKLTVEIPAKPLIDVDFSFAVSDDDEDEEFYDSPGFPEGPNGFEASSIP